MARSRKPPAPPAQVLTLEGFLPSSTNALMRMHWAERALTMRNDGQLVAVTAFLQGLAPAVGKRRVRLTFSQPSGRLRDPDNGLKAMLDHLKAAGLIIDDSAKWCETATPEVVRGPRRTVVVLEEVPR